MNRLIGQVNRPVIVFIQRVRVPKIELYKTHYGMGGGAGSTHALRHAFMFYCSRYGMGGGWSKICVFGVT